MQFEIFVHGTPNGQQLLGNSSEVFGRFVQTFYAANTSEIAEKLRVDRLTIGENSALFYSLVIARGVLGDDGREGGYVALSLQLDSLARNTGQIYDLLKALYLTKVLGRIVRTKEGGKVQFVSSKLSSVGGSYISELEQFVANYIKENIGLAGFAPIPREEKKEASRASVVRINRLDLAESRVVSLLLQGNSIEISDEFPSQALASQVEELHHKLEASESGASRKLAEMQKAHEQATASVEQQWQSKIDQLAQENANQLEAVVDFKTSDVLDDLKGPYDLIVSNPPYISREDVEEVGVNVLASEPHLALFADRDGYAIYEKIALQAPSVLTPDGKIYLEIGYKQGKKVKELFQKAFPDKRVRVLKDQFGQDRMVVVDNGSI